jgi:hypothetical protein
MSQNFGAGGSAQVNVLATGNTVTLSTAWTRYSSTIAVPSTSGKTFGSGGDDNTQLEIWYSSGATLAARSGNIGVQSGTVQIWGVQLEIAQPGQTAPTPLEKLDPVTQLQQCQRFYLPLQFYFAAYQTAGSTIYNSVTLPTSMRAIPALAISSPSLTNGTNPVNSALNINVLLMRYDAVAAGTAFYNGTVNCSADL